jgi:predicted alpha/beta superfamily hydrolase
MKPILSFLLLLTIAGANAQMVKNNQVIIGQTDSIKSKILNEKRRIWVYLPSGYDDNLFAKKRYPVVYLLDGDAHFASVTGMIQQLSQVNGNTICPEMIVVAIPNTDRTRDLTPTNATVDADGKKTDEFRSSGGGEKFTSFIEKELIPHIDSVYPTQPYRILIGHSFGGLTVMNIVINHTDMFNSYVAIDPSMWWDGKKLLNQARQVFAQKKFTGKTLFLGIANTMSSGMDTLHVRKDTAALSAHIRSILELKDILQSNPGNGLAFAYKYYNDDSHGSVPLITEYDALRFLFPF